MHVRRALALTVLAPLVLAGCSNGDPEADPTPKMPDSTSSSPSPTESESPEVESAEDFIRRWQEASDKAQTSGDTTEYRALSDRCEPCKGFADRVDEIYAEGGSIKFEGSQVRSVKSDGGGSDAYKVRIDSSPASVVGSDGQQTSTLDGGTLLLHLFLRPDGASWSVAHFTVLPS